jgi:hypothetical protein
MIVTYEPDGSSEPTVWTIDLDNDFRSSEMEQIESLTKLEYGSEFILALMRKGAKARRALLYILLRRQHRTLKYNDLDFSNKQLTVEMDKDEWAAEREKLVEDKKVPEAEKVERLGVIDLLMANAPEAPGKLPALSAGSAESSD